MEIKPKLNLDWYKGEDSYSDGNVEDDIIKYIMENAPEDYGRTIMEHYSWPVYYHLTHTRQNLLNWYPFKKEASVLEIGCGMGAITALLCDRCRTVTAVELSKRRVEAAQLRCRAKDNLEIIAGNLNDIEFDRKFDYITLIGVLEYQGTYTNSDNPYKDFLVRIRSLLKEGGKLLIAIENKYGLKYWCGAPEDHTGIPFDGINQYKLSGGKVRTFSREELTRLLAESGYMKSFYYFPMPDYKLPTVIYSEKYLPRNGMLENVVPYYIPSDQTLVVEEEAVYKDIVRNGVFDFFANSYLVECSAGALEEEEEKTVFALMSSKRQREYRIGTKVNTSGQAVKFPLEDNKHIRNHLIQIMENGEKLEHRGLKALSYRMDEDELISDYMDLPLFEDALYDAAARGDADLLWKLWDKLLEQIEESSNTVEQKECIIYELEMDRYEEGKDYGKILREGYLDMIPRNCFIREGEMLWFDQEWTLDHIPSKYILFRGMMNTYIRFAVMHDVIPMQEWLEHYGIDIFFPTFLSMDALFDKMILDEYYAGYDAEKRDEQIYKKNIVKLLQ